VKYIFALLMLFCLTNIEAKESQKIDTKEVKKLGNELRKELNELFKTETLLTQDDLLPDSQRGKRFDGTNAQKSVFALELEKNLEESNVEDIDEAEYFLQMSAQIINDLDNDGNLPEVAHEYREETCEESFANVHRLKEIRSVKVIPAITETRLTCRGHTTTLTAKYNTKKSIKELKKNIDKNTGSNIEILGKEVQGGNIVVNYRHRDASINDANPVNKIHTHIQGCFGAKKENITIREEQHIITWHVDSPELEANLKNSEGCHLMDQSYPDEDTRFQVWHCEAGDNQKCQSLRDAGGILKEKTCLQEDQEGNCLKYLKTFSFESRKPLEKGYFLDDQELFDLKDFETESEADGLFGWILSKLAIAFQSASSAGEDMQQIDPMKSEVFPGKEMKCRKSCSAKHIFDCCGRDSKDFAKGKCSADEELLLQKRLEKKCHYIGDKDLKIGLEKEQVYICYGDIISREIQEGAHKQLGIDWGTAKEPNKKGVILEELLGLDFERMDFSDFEVAIKKKTDANIPDIQKKIQATVDSLRPEEAKSQTETLLKEDMRKCFD
jgi:hypothetical protein